MPLNTIVVLLLIVSIIVLIVASRSNASYLRIAQLVCLLLTGALFYLMIFSNFSTDRKIDQASNANERAQRALGIYTGQRLGIEYSEARITVVTPLLESVPVGIKILIDNLRQTLEENGATVSLYELEIPQEVVDQFSGVNEEVVMEMLSLDTSMWLTPQRWFTLLTSLNTKADIVVSIVHCSKEIDLGLLPTTGQAPNLVLLNTPVINYQWAFDNSCLHAVVSRRNTSDPTYQPNKISSDVEEAFHQRFLWVDKNNVTAFLQQIQSD